MRIIESSVEYLPQSPGLDGIYKQIELCTRVSYKSENNITADSAKKFVDSLIKSKHYAGLEHGTVYLTFDKNSSSKLPPKYYIARYFYYYNPYSIINEDYDNIYVTTNYRVLVENGKLGDLDFLTEPTDKHKKRYSYKFITDIGVCRELLRHRKFSFINESTRYCNYSKDKFENEITFIKPSWANINTGKYEDDGEFIHGDGYIKVGYTPDDSFIFSLIQVEKDYLYLISKGCSPQEARQVLNLATKTELCMTGFEDDWNYLLDLRLFGKTGKPHPDMVELMTKFQKVYETR